MNRAGYAAEIRSVDVERIEYQRPSNIVTTASPERSNARYSRSEWRLTGAKDGDTKVRFQLEFEPDFWVPRIIGSFAIKRLLGKVGPFALRAIDDMALIRALPPEIASQ
jgi:hypothetical protein